MTSCLPAAVVDQQPARAQLRGVQGDLVGFRLQLRGDDGQLVDVSQWVWRATVITAHLRLDFEHLADEQGVRLWLRGDDTARLPAGPPCPFDVACRQPEASEGVTVLAGELVLLARVTDPLRDDPDAQPRDEELVPR